MIRRGAMTGLSLLALFAIAVASRPLDAATLPPLTTREGVVAADNEQASQVGAAVLAAGGNAIDAAVATALALGVVHPASSGIGGGGFAVVYVAKEDKFYAFDFRETGPAKIRPELFAGDDSLSRRGGLAVGVPGEVAGLDLLSKRFGRLPWMRVVEPAADLAARGFELTSFMQRAIVVWLPRAGADSRLGTVFRHLAAHRPGATIHRYRLAETLRRIGKNRSAGFYQGPVADDIIATVQQAGGVMEAQDLHDYQVREVEPLRGRWNDLEIVTMPLPSSGGIAVIEALGILDASGIDLAKLGAGSSASSHLIVEILKHAFADRARFLGDKRPDAVVGRLLDPKRLAGLAKRVNMRRTGKPSSYGDASLGSPVRVRKDGGTSHLCAVDAEGNAVSLTTTVNTYFGSGLVTKGGVVLNNEIDDFSTQPGEPNAFGLIQSDFNLVGPGKRPLSSMTPVLVRNERGIVACAGGSGGPRIISNTLQALLNVFVFGMDARAAVSAPRVHHQWSPDKVVVESDTVSDVIQGLKGRGHQTDVSPYATAVQMIVIDSEGYRHAASDPRKGGAPRSAP